MTDTVNLVIVTFNRIERTGPTLASIRDKTSHPHVLTVIDNNSEDGTREWLIQQRGQGLDRQPLAA